MHRRAQSRNRGIALSHAMLSQVALSHEYFNPKHRYLCISYYITTRFVIFKIPNIHSRFVTLYLDSPGLIKFHAPIMKYRKECICLVH